jgi:hypothetical protein
MATKSVHPIIVIATVVVLIALVGYFGFRAVVPPAPAAGSYTPGVPPWMDKHNSNYGKVQAPPGGAPATQASAPAAK